MADVVVLNNNLARENPNPPMPAVKENGSFYNWRMFYQDYELVADSDSYEELINLIIPGYKLLTEENKSEARKELALRLRLLLRVQILANVTKDKWETLEEWEKEWLESETDPVPNWEGQAPVWKSDIPLGLLTSSYFPHVEGSYAPLSIHGDFKIVENIIWLDDTDEQEFLKSLSRIDYINFGKPILPFKAEKLYEEEVAEAETDS